MKRMHVVRWITLGVILMLWISCRGADSEAPNLDATTTRAVEQTQMADLRATVSWPATPVQPTPSAPLTRTVTHVIDSNPSGVVSLTYVNETGGTSEAVGVRTPWTKALALPVGTIVHLSAKNGRGALNITCGIVVDGERMVSSGARGSFVIANCDLRVP